MRPWTWVRRILALVVTVVFALGLFVTPALAKSKSFSSGSRSFSSGSRSFSAPKSSPTPKSTSPSRSFSSPPKTTTPKTTAPKSTSPAPSRSFSTTPPPSASSGSKTYTSPDSKSFSSGSRSFSTPGGSFSSEKPKVTLPPSGGSGGSTTTTPKSTGSSKIPPVTYDTSQTRYPSMPPVVVIGTTPFDPWYYHDWYWGRPWYWRIWHRPHYTASGGWAVSWLAIIVALAAVWVLLGVLSSIIAKRRRNR